jgi:hypothetical protein
LRLNASMSLTVQASHLSIEYPSYPPLFLIGLIEIKSALVKRYNLKFRDQDSGRAYHTRLPSPHRQRRPRSAARTAVLKIEISYDGRRLFKDALDSVVHRPRLICPSR